MASPSQSEILQPVVSVLMLTYNHAPYISQAIESVLGQNTEYPLELIICDDASTDDTQNIVRGYADKDPRIVLSLQPCNTEFGKNFVDGCARIRGRYVAFCEGDDYWSDMGKLQKQVAFLEEHPDFSVCAHKVQMLIMDSQQPSNQQKFVYKDCTADDQRLRDGIFYADEAIANYYFQTGSLVLRWRFTEGLPHWFRKRMMFDHFMFMLHAVEGKIKYFDEVMSVWRRHGGGYTWLQNKDKGLFFQKEGKDWIAMYQRMDEFFSKRFTWQIRERIFLALRSIAENCMTTGNIDQLRALVDEYGDKFEWVLKDAVLLDALRMAYPEKPEFSPPWESASQEEPYAERNILSQGCGAVFDTEQERNVSASLSPTGIRTAADNGCIVDKNIDACTSGLYQLVQKEHNEIERMLKNTALVDDPSIACSGSQEYQPSKQCASPKEPEAAQEESLQQHAAAPETKGQEKRSSVATVSMDDCRTVGGCFEWALEDIPPTSGSVWEAWTGEQEYARFFNLRSALFRWLWQHGVSTLWLPTYCPPIMENNRYECQFTRKFYTVGNTLEPGNAFLSEVRSGEAVLTIQYLGRPLPDAFCNALAARKDILWIEDRAQSLDSGQTSRANAVIYSPRKLFGVPDGGLLVGKGARALEDWCTHPSLVTLEKRHALLMRRYERPDMDGNTHNLRWLKHDLEHQLSRCRMSRATEALLRRLPLNSIVQRRQDNWKYLYQRLGSFCLWKIPRPEFAPYAFPFLVPQDYPAEILHTLLARHKVFCQRMWYPLKLRENLYPLEEGIAKRLLLIPCDQRYGEKEMRRIAELIERILENPHWDIKTDGSFNVAN